VPRETGRDVMKAYTAQGLLKGTYTVLGEILFLVLFPLIAIVGVLYLVCFWVYLVFWCGWRGGPE